MTTGAAIAAGLLFSACGSYPNPPPPCPIGTIDLRPLSDSTFDWTYRDLVLAPESTGFVPSPPSGYDCSFSFSGGSVAPPESFLGAHFDPGSIALTCSGGPYGLFGVKLSSLGDIRDWPAGTFTLTPPTGTVTITGFIGGGTSNLSDLAVTVTVEDAVGGSAPFPELVTSDYVRTFRVDFDTASVAPKDANGRADVPMTVRASLHLTQTATDYTADPNAVCLYALP